jgi:hypothetical protein
VCVWREEVVTVATSKGYRQAGALGWMPGALPGVSVVQVAASRPDALGSNSSITAEAKFRNSTNTTLGSLEATGRDLTRQEHSPLSTCSERIISSVGDEALSDRE